MTEELAEDLLKIQEKYQIESERFASGVEFALKIQDGENKNSSYAAAFKCTREQARNRSSQLYRTKWIQEIISATEVEDELRDIQSREDIKTQMSSLMTDAEEDKDKIAAARVLLSATEKKKNDREQEAVTAQSTAREILNHLKVLSKEGKMISMKGEVIDIDVIE